MILVNSSVLIEKRRFFLLEGSLAVTKILNGTYRKNKILSFPLTVQVPRESKSRELETVDIYVG